MAVGVEKPSMIKLHMMNGPSDKLNTITAKWKGGLIEYNGMDPEEPIVWFGEPGYAIFDVKTKKNELYYDVKRKRLIKLSHLGGTPTMDAISELGRHVMIAAKKTDQNMGVAQASKTLEHIVLGLAFITFLMFMVFAYMMWTHMPSVPNTPAPKASNQSISNQVNSSTLIHINTGS